MKRTIRISAAFFLLLVASPLAQAQAQPLPEDARHFPQQWIELRLTGYQFADWNANRRAWGNTGFYPLGEEGAGAAIARIWAKDRLLTRIGYDRLSARGAPSADLSNWYSSRGYHFYTVEAGPVWVLGQGKRHMLSSTVGLVHRRGGETYHRGYGLHSGGFYEPYINYRRAADWGSNGKIEYHFSPVRHVRLGIVGQYHRYFALGGEQSYGWPEGVIGVEQWSWGFLLGVGY